MSVASELRAQVKPGSETRAILGPAGNRARDLEAPKRKKEGLKKPKGPVPAMPQSAVRDNVSIDTSCSSDSSFSESSVKIERCKRKVKHSAVKPAIIVPEAEAAAALSLTASIPVKRCEWITSNSEPVYTGFHDEEWGVAVHDDRKLFELLVLSQALAEFTWPVILSKRDTFRKLLDDFEPSSIAKFTDGKLLSLRANGGGTLVSEQKLRAVVENANQLLKVQREFGSFSNYCWSFVSHKPIAKGFRNSRQVPTKTPKAEVMSKDLIQRGFRCVGPTIVYSFMQVSGMVNDHLLTCFRYRLRDRNN